eukprot:6137235-Pyramimonas_sp.AAC.1
MFTSRARTATPFATAPLGTTGTSPRRLRRPRRRRRLGRLRRTGRLTIPLQRYKGYHPSNLQGLLAEIPRQRAEPRRPPAERQRPPAELRGPQA